MATTVLFLLLTVSASATAAATRSNGNRRILHQPFIPLDAPTPPFSSQQPQSTEQQQDQPQFPLSDQSPPPELFFPVYPPPPPPPPPPSSLFTFPANISALMLPQSPSSHKHSSKKLVAVTISVSILSVALIAALAAFRLRRHGNHGHQNNFFSDKDSSIIDHLHEFPHDTASSDGDHKPPPTIKRGVSSTSFEFLYLGNHASSRVDEKDDRTVSNSNKADTTSAYVHERLGSPELHPLPPLSRQNYRNSAMRSLNDDEENDDDEFFSPRGSTSGGRDSPHLTGSSSRREFQAMETDNIRTRSSFLFPYSNSVSPIHSMSGSPFVPLTFSPGSLISRSPDSIINFPAPARPIPPHPPRERRTRLPSPPSPSERTSVETLNSPSRASDFSGHYVGIQIPSPPPPPPPVKGPPVLVRPSRPILDPTLLSGQTPILEDGEDPNEATAKPKLKPLHRDRIRVSSDRAMAWDQFKSSYFRLNDEMNETLFMINSSNSSQENRVLDPKKFQTIAVLLRAQNLTIEEVCEAILDGNADILGTELLDSLLKMAPTEEEERKLKDESPLKLSPAEKFLKTILEIPFAFKRVDAMLYMSVFDSEIEYLKKYFESIEGACQELRNNRTFQNLLEAVLKTTKHDSKLDALLKLMDIKGTDGTPTPFHFLVQEITRVEGYRLSGANPNDVFDDEIAFTRLGVEIISGLSGELTNVKKVASMDSKVLISNKVAKLAAGLTKIHEVLRLNEDTREFSKSMAVFLNKGEEDIGKIQVEESVALSALKELTKYFHGSSREEEGNWFVIFVVVRDFLCVLDRVCKEVGKLNERKIVNSSHRQSQLSFFPEMQQRRFSDNEDDEESSSEDQIFY